MRSPGDDYIHYLLDMLAPLGEVRARRMFGGHGIFIEDLMFGLVVNDELYFKVDAHTRQTYASRGLEAFSYMSKDRSVSLSYFAVPEEALEDSNMLCDWGRDAIAVAMRGRK